MNRNFQNQLEERDRRELWQLSEEVDQLMLVISRQLGETYPFLLEGRADPVPGRFARPQAREVAGQHACAELGSRHKPGSRQREHRPKVDDGLAGPCRQQSHHDGHRPPIGQVDQVVDRGEPAFRLEETDSVELAGDESQDRALRADAGAKVRAGGH
jgi:hypothetical protein